MLRDRIPTYLAAAGDTDIKAKLKKGDVKAIGREYKVHLDPRFGLIGRHAAAARRRLSILGW